jgi:hypothetical protein
MLVSRNALLDILVSSARNLDHLNYLFLENQSSIFPSSISTNQSGSSSSIHQVYNNPVKKMLTLLKYQQNTLVLFVCLFVWWCLTPLSQYFSYIVVVSFIGGGNRRTWENHRPVASYWQTLSHNAHLALIEIRTHNISSDRHRLHR